MILIDALPKNEAGYIELPIFAVDKKGNYYPGFTTVEYVQSKFSDFVNKTVPLSDTDYQALLEASTENWKLNWQEFRKQGII